MDRIHLISLFLIVSSLFIGQNTPPISPDDTRHFPEDVNREISPKETKLLLDESLAGYINAQAKLDGADRVVIIADTILVTEKVTLKEVDVIIAANYFSTEGRQVEVLPAETNTKRSGISGKHGKEVQVIAKHIDRARFYLPGMDGTKGSDGRNGRNGNKNEVKNPGDVSMGTPGADGKDGGRGGNGGNLLLYTQHENYQVRLTAPGGRGGAGGKGGTGGTTFIRIVAKPGKPNPDPNQPEPGGNIQIQNNKTAIKARKVKDGKNGKHGRGGIKGKEEVKLISDKQFETLLRKHYHHDVDNLYQTGWQILFSK